MFQSGDGGSFSIVLATPEEFENRGITLNETLQLFSVHTTLRKMHVQGKRDIEVIVKCQGTEKLIIPRDVV